MKFNSKFLFVLLTFSPLNLSWFHQISKFVTSLIVLNASLRCGFSRKKCSPLVLLSPVKLLKGLYQTIPSSVHLLILVLDSQGYCMFQSTGMAHLLRLSGVFRFKFFSFSGELSFFSCR